MPRITDTVAKQAKARTTRYDLRDKDGLILRIHPTGTKIWQHVFEFQGKRHRVRLGEYGEKSPGLSVVDARKDHAEQRYWLAAGQNPAEIVVQKKQTEDRKAHAERQAPTVYALVDEYMEQYAKQHKKSWKEDERILRGYLLPALGMVKAKDITRRDIVLLLDQVRDHGKPNEKGRPVNEQPGAPVQANRLLAVTRRMFGFAVERDILPASPITHIKAPARETARERVLSESEIRDFVNRLDNAPASEAVKAALLLVLLTGQRNTEVREMRWDEIEGDWWTIPSARTKNGLTHRVPLTETALLLLDIAQVLGNGSDWVFPSPIRDGEKPLSQLALTRVLSRAGWDFTVHDLRRTVGTELGRLGFNRLIQDRVLNHKDQTVGGIYDRYSYDAEKRKALEAWERRVLALAAGEQGAAKVVPLMRRA